MTTLNTQIEKIYVVSFEISFGLKSQYKQISMCEAKIVHETWKNYIIIDKFERKLNKSKILWYKEFIPHNEINEFNTTDNWYQVDIGSFSGYTFYTADINIVKNIIDSYYNSLNLMEKHINNEFERETVIASIIDGIQLSQNI